MAPADTTAASQGPPPPRSFDDKAMIRAAYPLLYGREATAEEVALGLAFLAEQRTSLLASETAKAAAAAAKPPGAVPATPAPTAAVKAEVGAEAGKELLARRVSMKAWTQYARALFSAAEFRFID